jgi:hypothetical protein
MSRNALHVQVVNTEPKSDRLHVLTHAIAMLKIAAVLVLVLAKLVFSLLPVTAYHAPLALEAHPRAQAMKGIALSAVRNHMPCPVGLLNVQPVMLTPQIAEMIVLVLALLVTSLMMVMGSNAVSAQ